MPQNVDAQSAFRISDSAGTNYLAQIATYQSTDSTGLRFTIRDKFDSNGFSPSGTNRNKHFHFLQNASNQSYIQWDGYANNSIVPLANNTYDLGTSTNKWKSLNGINPGALSFPDYSSAVNIDTTSWSTAGVMITYTPTFPGWLQITVSGGSGSYITILDSGTNPRAGQRITGDGIDRLFLTYPVIANRAYWIYIVSASIVTARIVPCLGNV